MTCPPQINTYVIVGKKQDTEKGKGNTMMHAIWLLWLAKGMSQDEARSSSEEIKPVAFCTVEL